MPEYKMLVQNSLGFSSQSFSHLKLELKPKIDFKKILDQKDNLRAQKY